MSSAAFAPDPLPNELLSSICAQCIGDFLYSRFISITVAPSPLAPQTAPPVPQPPTNNTEQATDTENDAENDVQANSAASSTAEPEVNANDSDKPWDVFVALCLVSKSFQSITEQITASIFGAPAQKKQLPEILIALETLRNSRRPLPRTIPDILLGAPMVEAYACFISGVSFIRHSMSGHEFWMTPAGLQMMPELTLAKARFERAKELCKQNPYPESVSERLFDAAGVDLELFPMRSALALGNKSLSAFQVLISIMRRQGALQPVPPGGPKLPCPPRLVNFLTAVFSKIELSCQGPARVGPVAVPATERVPVEELANQRDLLYNALLGTMVGLDAELGGDAFDELFDSIRNFDALTVPDIPPPEEADSDGAAPASTPGVTIGNVVTANGTTVLLFGVLI